MSASRGVRVLETTAALLSVLGVALLVWPVGRVSPSAAAANSATVSAPNATSRSSAEGDALAEQIVNTNLFSATRRAPRERFVLPGTTTMPDPSTYLLPPGTVMDAGPVLYGIVTVDGTRRALLQLHPDSAPRVAAVGQRLAGYRVRAIGADRVELSSSSGSRVVRLSRAVPDSSGTLP